MVSTTRVTVLHLHNVNSIYSHKATLGTHSRSYNTCSKMYQINRMVL